MGQVSFICPVWRTNIILLTLSTRGVFLEPTNQSLYEILCCIMIPCTLYKGCATGFFSSPGWMCIYERGGDYRLGVWLLINVYILTDLLVSVTEVAVSGKPYNYDVCVFHWSLRNLPMVAFLLNLCKWMYSLYGENTSWNLHIWIPESAGREWGDGGLGRL